MTQEVYDWQNEFELDTRFLQIQRNFSRLDERLLQIQGNLEEGEKIKKSNEISVVDQEIPIKEEFPTEPIVDTRVSKRSKRRRSNRRKKKQQKKQQKKKKKKKKEK